MKRDTPSLLALTEQITQQEELLKQGKRAPPSLALGRLPVRKRLEILLDHPDSFFELGTWAGWNLYPEAPSFPCAGVVTGIGQVTGHHCMIIANDPQLFDGALFPQSVKKILRAQKIAYLCRLPLLYLLDTCGIYMPRQDESFPDEDDFGRIVRNCALIAEAKIPQLSAIMGLCASVASYIPALCNTVLMTEGSSLYLTDPATVKAAIGQLVEREELGSAKMQEEVSGSIDFLEKDDRSCLMRMRAQVELLPEDPHLNQKKASFEVEYYPYNIYEIMDVKGTKNIDTRDVISCIIDRGSLQEFKSFYGQSIITAYAKINGFAVGIVANQRASRIHSKERVEYGGVLYAESVEKGARFINDCNQMHLPLLFLQDIDGLMIGKDAERAGIIHSTAKMIQAVSSCSVGKITVVIGNSFGPGTYAFCGKAFDPHFIFAWPNAQFSSKNLVCSSEAQENDLLRVAAQEELLDVTYGAARGWVDGIIAPHQTREVVTEVLTYISRQPSRDHLLPPRAL